MAEIGGIGRRRIAENQRAAERLDAERSILLRGRIPSALPHLIYNSWHPYLGTELSYIFFWLLPDGFQVLTRLARKHS